MPNKLEVFLKIFYRVPCPKTGKMAEMKILKETESDITLQCSECGVILTREIGFFNNLMRENPSNRNSSI